MYGLSGTDYRVATLNCYRNHYVKFEIEKTILTSVINYKSYPLLTKGWTYKPY